MPSAQGAQGSSLSANGARVDNTNFVIDGITNQNSRSGSVQSVPSLDSLQEFKMQVNGYSAEYGRLAGGVVNAVLKTGSNQLHGSVFEFLRNDVFDARNFFDADKSKLKRNQFGATANGPVTCRTSITARQNVLSGELGKLPLKRRRQPVEPRPDRGRTQWRFLAEQRSHNEPARSVRRERRNLPG